MPRFSLTLGTLVFFTGCEKATNIPGEDLPQIDISAKRVDFGDVEWGETAYETVTIRNTGALPMGLSGVSLGGDEMEDSFALHLGRTVYCTETALPDFSDTGAPMHPQASRVRTLP